MNDAQIQPFLRSATRRLVDAVMLAALAGATVSGQQPQNQDDSAPPPVKVISSLEREQLNASKDSKARVKTSIMLAEAHLAKAEAQTGERSYDSALGETARYWAIMENALAYVAAMKQDSNKTRDLYKRLELALRAHGPRLSGLRRTTPIEYGVWIKEIEEFARKGRTEALNSFYGETVVRDAHRSPGEPKPVPKPLEENSAAPRPNP
jgi:hypothetical protein